MAARGRGSVRGRGQGRGFAPGHLRNLSSSLSGLLSAIADTTGAPAPAVSLASTRGGNRRGRGRGRGATPVAARVEAASQSADPAGGSGLVGVQNMRQRKDLVFGVTHQLAADNAIKRFGPDATFAGLVTGKNPVLEAVRVRVQVDAGFADVAGEIGIIISPDQAQCPHDATTFAALKSASMKWEVSKFPRNNVKKIPHDFGVLCSGAKDEKGLPHLCLAVGILRRRNGLTDQDQFGELLIEFLFSHD